MLTIKITELNNKSRKGTYVYIKEKGKRSAYYKLRENLPVDTIEQYYKERYIKKETKERIEEYAKKREKRPTTEADKYLREIRRRPTIQKAINKGITSVNIRNALASTTKEVNRTKRELLRPLVKDKRLLKLLMQHQNMEKIKTRLEYRIKIKDTKGKTRITATKFNSTPEKIINELKKEFRTGTKTEYIEGKINKMGYQSINGKKEEFTIGSIAIQTIFRKAR